MKKIIIYTSRLALILIVFLTVGCEDYLNKEPLDGFSDESVYSDEALATSYLMNVYNYIPRGFGARDATGVQPEYKGNDGGEGNVYIWDVCTDNARNKSTWPLSQKIFVPGLMTPTNLVWNNWEGNYKGIRKANLLIAGLENDSPIDEASKSRLIAEARWVRSFLYFRLARRFGDVPLIITAQSFDDDLMTKQTAQLEVYDFISAELDAVAPLLPAAKNLSGNEYGRATMEAAWALQGRVLLFAASVDASYYAKSAAASLKVMNSDFGYTLSPDYSALFQTDGSEHDKEVIFEIMGDPVAKKHGWDFYASSKAFGGHSQYLPTQELVDEYETINGLPIDEDPTYNDQDPYANRDSRLAATVVYHDMDYRGRKTDHARTKNTAGEIVAVGADLQAAPYTGYWTKKFCYVGDAVVSRDCYQSWKELRLGEVLLNYAEAQNHAVGPDASVYAAMDAVRSRAKIPTLTAVRPGLSQEAMVEEILHERRVELAFENHRYWDLVRNKIAHIVLKGYFHGMNIFRDEDTGALTYERFVFNKKTKEQTFPMRYYRMPIPQGEMDKNPNLIQNEGY
ncbi:MAG: RagB/SusD family nutrient uptake outer membrane protein [Labilibaculum sp.]|nr:RagB/SusD family nutrient uptake outer membrane protein [Labilibaculum sp.]MBI9057355.1 RagB/SusD family nutrient uptake outer membrane protein [Labilibaculum sp.]